MLWLSLLLAFKGVFQSDLEGPKYLLLPANLLSLCRKKATATSIDSIYGAMKVLHYLLIIAKKNYNEEMWGRISGPTYL